MRKDMEGFMYDHYISLGENCEAAFNFRRVVGKDISYYFNWLVVPIDALIKIVSDDFEGDFERGNLYYKGEQVSMITDRKYNISHHNPFKEIDGVLSGAAFDDLYGKHVEKLALFKRRFRAVAKSQMFVLYFIKASDLTGAKNDVRSKSRMFRDLMRKQYPSHKFHIVVLQERGRFEPQWNDDGIFNRYLERFAPFNNVPDFHVESWDRVFSEFPLNPGAMDNPIDC